MAVTYYDNYSPVGDVMVLAISMVFFILIRATYINKQKNYFIFFRILIMLPVAAMCNMAFHLLMNRVGEVSNWLIYVFRLAYHVSLFGMLVLYLLYALEMVKMSEALRLRYKIAAYAGYLILILYEGLGVVFKFGFYIDEQGKPHGGFPFFAVGYVYFIGLTLWILYRHGERLYRQVVRGVIGCTAVSFFVMFMQGIHDQRSFTTASFTFPVFALLYLVHANPYDLTIGAIGADSLRDLLKNARRKKRTLYLMSLYMPDFDRPGSEYPEFIQSNIRSFSSVFFKDTTLFGVGDGHLILAIDITHYPDYEKSSKKMIEAFYVAYGTYQFDYKIVTVKTDYSSKEIDYINLIQYVQNRIPINSVKEAGEKEIRLFEEHKFIVSELADVAAKKDPEDPRVLVFCQPVYNTAAQCYDTAEALMRLKLPQLGMVFPDRFIPIAEKYNYIQALSQIILAKVCRQARELLDAGYHFTRISVNMSTLDLRERDFSEVVKDTISKAGVPPELIAIEITESQNESEFQMAQTKISELQKFGIKFYLDDFGTGYSNFERIMELPFDIIKFDRSLTIASGESSKSEIMVSYLAHMFSDMGYAALYEGVEDEADEERCMRMYAKYLQGYKYSKPVPIEQLTEFFVKEKEFKK